MFIFSRQLAKQIVIWVGLLVQVGGHGVAIEAIPKKLMNLRKNFAKISQGLSDIFHCHGQSRLLSHWHHLMFDAGFHCGCMEHEEGRDSPLVGT